jgi:hypothetical protein
LVRPSSARSEAVRPPSFIMQGVQAHTWDNTTSITSSRRGVCIGCAGLRPEPEVIQRAGAGSDVDRAREGAIRARRRRAGHRPALRMLAGSCWLRVAGAPGRFVSIASLAWSQPLSGSKLPQSRRGKPHPKARPEHRICTFGARFQT